MAHFVQGLTSDAGFALRLLRRSPAFAAIAVVSLGLGIGANTAIFSLIDRVLLKTLPVADPHTLFFVDNSGGKSSGTSGPPYPCYELLRDQNRSLSAIAAFRETNFKVTIDGAAEQLNGHYASGVYFDLLGVKAIHGRVFTPADDSIIGQGGPDGGVAVISHNLWRRRFDMDPSVLGKTIQVGTRAVTIVGVTPPEFFGLQLSSPADVTIPFTLTDNNLKSRSLWWFSVIGRIKPGITVEQARAELHAIWDRYMTEIGQPREKRTYFSGIELVPASRGLAGLRLQLSQPLLIVMVIVALVLLIGCANVANLLLARATARRHEIAVRLAIGAGRGRLVRQLLTEGAVLVVLGVLAGLLFAQWGVTFLAAFLADADDARVLGMQFDARLLTFTTAVGVITTLLFSLAPALQATRLDAGQTSSIAAISLARPRARLGRGLIVIQVSLAVVLLSGAALFLRTLLNLQRVHSGFESAGVLTVEMEAVFPRPTVERPTPAEVKARFAQIGAAWTELGARVASLPGVRAGSIATMTPLTGRDRGVVIAIAGREPLTEPDRSIHVNTVTPGYFDVLGIRLLAGRFFTDRDGAAAPRVAILNQSAARTYFGDRNPLGARVTFPGQRVGDEYEIIGVAADMRYESLREEDERMAYLPIEQAFDPIGGAVLLLRGTGDASQHLGSIREAAAKVLPGGFVSRAATMNERVDRSLVRERLLATLSTFFGSLALVLGCIGLYGVMAFATVHRTREIGIRIAVGAQLRAVSWMIVRETLMLVLAGAVAGAVAASAAGRFVQGQLFGVAPGDPIATALAVLLLVTGAVVAAYVPARRAARIDPVIALRHD